MPKKIFELANEMSIGALDLVEKLKSLGFNVRNHMSTLSDEEIALFLEKLKGSNTPEKKKSSKVAKKKVSIEKVSTPVTVDTQAQSSHPPQGHDEITPVAPSPGSTTTTTRKKAIVRKKAPGLSAGHDEGEPLSHRYGVLEEGEEEEKVGTLLQSEEDFETPPPRPMTGADEKESSEELFAESSDHSHPPVEAQESKREHEEKEKEKEEKEVTAATTIQEESQASTSERAPLEATSTATMSTPINKEKEKDEIERPRGLRVVYRPTPPTPTAPAAAPTKKVEAVVTPTPAAETKTKAPPKEKEKIYYEEKMHTFTPVYIPPKKSEVTEAPKSRTAAPATSSTPRRDVVRRPHSQTAAANASSPSSSSTHPGSGSTTGGGVRSTVKRTTLPPGSPSTHPETVPPTEEFTEEQIAARKKSQHASAASALAAAKAAKATKARDITLMRAEEELKSYSIGLVGKVVYSPVGRKKVYTGPTKETKITALKDSKRVINVHNGLTAEELAQKLSIKFEDLRDQCLDLNLLIRANDYFGIKLLSDIAGLFKYRIEDISFKEEDILEQGNTEKEVADVETKIASAATPKSESESESSANKKAAAPTKTKSASLHPHRAPVVTIMGHVDHGKTTLLDYIRKTKVAQGEAGGITQHVAAYVVQVGEQKITFIDTPGHAAFGAIRERGAKLTDIVVLVVAADDGVMPQTKESIKFCKENEVPIIVAINKVDKENLNFDRIKNELLEFALTPEEWGGETQYVPVSGLKGIGIDSLLEGILLQAEIMELNAPTKGNAIGTVIESKMEQGRGALVTTLIKSGTLRRGDYVVTGENSGRVRGLLDHRGESLNEAGPSTPVIILGLDGTPQPGESLNVVKNEREAKKIVENRITMRRERGQLQKPKVSLEDFLASKSESKEEKKILKLIVRSDVQGSFEAIKGALQNLGNQEVGIDIIGGGVGAISDTDVQLASSAEGFIVGFNVGPTTTARQISESQGVDIKTYRIIYELIDEVKLALEGLLTPLRIEKYIGRVEVRNVFTVPKIGMIAGSSVVDGKVERGCNIRVLRDGKIIHEGKLSSLKRFKDDVKEVKNGHECGISVDTYDKVQIGDILEAYTLEEKKRTLEGTANNGNS
ncbi:MAG: translation initiation factor IF-2 [Oligoflexia bacterium]|nr:translation initiation factor IF-2 [Oligoflexia bacterium]